MIEELPICHTEMELVDKINEIITELNIIKVYEEVVKPAMLPEKENLYTSINEMKIPAYINGIGDCIVYAKCAKCRDNFQIDKPKSGKIVIYCPCCGKVLNYRRI